MGRGGTREAGTSSPCPEMWSFVPSEAETDSPKARTASPTHTFAGLLLGVSSEGTVSRARIQQWEERFSLHMSGAGLLKAWATPVLKELRAHAKQKAAVGVGEVLKNTNISGMEALVDTRKIHNSEQFAFEIEHIFCRGPDLGFSLFLLKIILGEE